DGTARSNGQADLSCARRPRRDHRAGLAVSRPPAGEEARPDAETDRRRARLLASVARAPAAARRPLLRSRRRRRRKRQHQLRLAESPLGGFGGMALVATVRWSFRGEGAGSAHSHSYWRDCDTRAEPVTNRAAWRHRL